MLEGISARSRIAAFVVGAGGQVLWRNGIAERVLAPGVPEGGRFEAVLELLEEAPEEVVHPELQQAFAPPLESPAAGKLYRLRSAQRDEPVVFRHHSLPLETLAGHVESPGAGEIPTLHCFIDSSQEQRLTDGFLRSLRQIRSMKEIVDILYESVSTQEVIYITLVAVTAQMGFGFNRAFFLQARGGRLRGRIGIGPSNHEEAHQIWSRLSAMNFSSLREVYQDLIREGGVPDPSTQELAVRMDFDLRTVRAGGAESRRHGGLAEALESGKPSRIHASDASTEMDRSLFQLLQTDVIAIVPLMVRGELAGVIITDNFIDRKPITEAGLNVLKTFAGYAGVALERSRLYDELRESVAKLQAANERLKSNQEKLLQAEKLSAVGELAACVSHEIRTPLVAIGGLARSLLHDPIADPATGETLTAIVTEVSRLEKFLGETLDFVKPKPTATAMVDLQELVRECLTPFRKELADGGVELECEVPEKPLRCVVDPGLLGRTITNLVRNAIEAMGGGGGRLRVSLSRKRLFAVLRVADTGTGIAPEVQARIFEPFFTTKTGGTGLGLAIASQSIRGIGGRLELDSTPGFKTTFKLVLPLEEAPADLPEKRGDRRDRGDMSIEGVGERSKEEVFSGGTS
jgi:signal transduction histidine kinase